MEPPPEDTDWLKMQPINHRSNWPSYVVIALMIAIVLTVMGWVIHLQYDAINHCRAAGGVWVDHPGACVEPNQEGRFP